MHHYQRNGIHQLHIFILGKYERVSQIYRNVSMIRTEVIRNWGRSELLSILSLPIVSEHCLVDCEAASSLQRSIIALI